MQVIGQCLGYYYTSFLPHGYESAIDSYTCTPHCWTFVIGKMYCVRAVSANLIVMDRACLA